MSSTLTAGNARGNRSASLPSGETRGSFLPPSQAAAATAASRTRAEKKRTILFARLRIFRLARSLYHRNNRAKEDVNLTRVCTVLHVIEIERKFLPRVVDGGPVTIVYLRPARQAGLDQVPIPVEGHFLFDRLYQFRSLWTRPNERHLSFEDIPKLRDLIEAGRPQELA